MTTAPTWEILLAVLAAVALVFLFRPGIRQALEQSRTAPRDWPGALLPIGVVVLFVLLLLWLV